MKRLGLLPYLVVAFTLLVSGPAGADDASDALPFDGWKVLSEDYDQNHILDVISYEWDYYTIVDNHSEFRAIIGYLVSNPRARFSDIVQLLPEGGNVAVVAQVGDRKPVGIYENYGLDNYEASGVERTFWAEDPQTGYFGDLEPQMGVGPNGEDGMVLRGSNEAFTWDLVVIQEWTEREIPGPRAVPGTDAGILPGEIWTIDPLWHRTRIIGTVVDHATGDVLDIDGHGYREIAHGRYHLATDGWDTLFFSEGPEDLAARGLGRDEGVSIINLTYHKSNRLDFADISFYDGDKLVAHRFRASEGEMSWYHPSWQWDRNAWQCTPLNGYWEYENEEYLIELDVEVGLENTGTLLSDITLPVSLYFIHEYFPYYEGVITHKPTGRIVREFSGRGVGEFSFHKSARWWPASRFECNMWGWHHFYRN